MFSGVAASAAMTRSPSFSRSSSSTTTAIPRRPIASMASCTSRTPSGRNLHSKILSQSAPPTPTCPSTRHQLCQPRGRRRSGGRRRLRRTPAPGRGRSDRPGPQRGNRGPRVAPPSTSSWTTPRRPSSRSTSPRSPESSRAGWTRAPGGACPSTTRSGWACSTPSSRRTVSSGSSARTVPAPTRTASERARRQVHVAAGGLPGDPAAGAVGGGRAGVQAGRHLEHDPGLPGACGA